MTDSTAEQMARQIAAKDAENRGADILAGNIRLGHCDDTVSVRCALAAIIETTERIANQEPAWDGLARDIMMWLDFGPGNRTPRTLFRHLQSTGRKIPQWLLDEPEMQNLDHTPSKGTRCVIL